MHGLNPEISLGEATLVLMPQLLATLTLAEPLTAAALGALVLAERPGAVAVAGAALVLAGLAALVLPAGSRGARGAPAPAGAA